MSFNRNGGNNWQPQGNLPNLKGNNAGQRPDLSNNYQSQQAVQNPGNFPQQNNQMNYVPQRLSAIQTLYQKINPNNQLRSLKQFFSKYDAYDGRIFSLWELQYMFPGVSAAHLKEIHQQNNREERIREDEISLFYLINQIEVFDNRLERTDYTGVQSIYVEKIIQLAQSPDYDDKNALEVLKQMSQACGQYPDRYFSDSYKDTFDVTFSQFSHQLQRQKEQVKNKLFNFFLNNSQDVTFNKINFCQAINHFEEMQKNPQQFLAKTSLNTIPGMNQNQQFMNPMSPQNNMMGGQFMQTNMMGGQFMNQPVGMMVPPQPINFMQTQGGMMQPGMMPMYNGMTHPQMNFNQAMPVMQQQFGYQQTQNFGMTQVQPKPLDMNDQKLLLDLKTTIETQMNQALPAYHPTSIAACQMGNGAQLIQVKIRIEEVERSMTGWIHVVIFKPMPPQLPEVWYVVPNQSRDTGFQDPNTIQKPFIPIQNSAPIGMGYTMSRPKTMTEAERQNAPIPPRFQTVIQETEWGYILMGLFIINKTAQEHFKNFTNISDNMTLQLVDFNRAVRESSGLNLKMQLNESQLNQIYEAIQRTCGKDNRPVLPEEIDKYFWYSHTTDYIKLRDFYMTNLQKHYENIKFDPYQKFNAASNNGQTELTGEPFKNIAFTMTNDVSELVKQFITSCYQKGSLGSVNYKEFLQDIEEKKKLRQQEIGFQQAADFTFDNFCDKIMKILYLTNDDLEHVFKIHDPKDQNMIDYNQFENAFLRYLQFGNEWSNFLRDLFNTLDRQKQRFVKFDVVKQWIKDKSQNNIDSLQDALWAQLLNQQKNANAIFHSHSYYMTGGRNMQTASISKIIQQNWRIDPQDADFFAFRIAKEQNQPNGAVDADQLLKLWQQKTNAMGYDSEEKLVDNYIRRFLFAAQKHKQEYKLREIFQQALSNDRDSVRQHLSQDAFKKAYQMAKVDEVQYGEIQAIMKYFADKQDKRFVDWQMFLSTVEDQNKMQNSLVLTADQQKQIQKIWSFTHGKKNKGPQDLWNDLRTATRDNKKQFARDKEILQIIQAEYFPKQNTTKETEKLTETLIGVISMLHTDHQGKRDIKQFMETIYGTQTASEIERGIYQPDNLSHTNHVNRNQEQVGTSKPSYGNTQGDLREKRKENFQGTYSNVATVNAKLGEVGDKIKTMGDVEKLENELVTRFKDSYAPNAPPKITLDQFLQGLQAQNVDLDYNQREQLGNLFKTQGTDNKMSLEKLLNQIGIKSKKFESTQKVVQILDRLALEQCHSFILFVKDYLIRNNFQTDKLLLDTFGQVESIDGKLFITQMHKIIKNDQTLYKKLDSDLGSKLIFYLMKEQYGFINVKKLKQALQMRTDDQPLKQDNIESAVNYQSTVKKQLNKFEQQKLFAFMFTEGKMDFAKFFNVQTITSIQYLTETDFKKKLQDQNYLLDQASLSAICQELRDADTKPGQVSFKLLYQNFQEFNNQQVDQKKVVKKLDFKLQRALEEMNKFIGQTKLHVNELFNDFDADKNGALSRDEFINGCSKVFKNVKDLDVTLYRDIYNAMDLNGDQNISVNEFGSYLKSSEIDLKIAVQNVDSKTKAQIQAEIRELFREIDTSGDGKINARELALALQQMADMNITEQQAQEMIESVDVDGNKLLDVSEFEQLMLPKMLESVVRSDQADEKFRQMFRKYDTDYSGYLTADELFMALTKEVGVVLLKEELIQLLQEFDQDGNSMIDIDEFVSLMNADNIKFQNQENQHNFNKIRQSRKNERKQMLKIFLTLPKTFVQSFTSQRWNKGRNTPSSEFAVRIDPKTMTWKDMQRPKAVGTQVDQPKIKPNLVSVGGLIDIQLAEGVPMPKLENNQKIVKRVIRMTLYDQDTFEFVFNSCQVTAQLQANTSDTWEIEKLNPILFRTSKQDQLMHSQLCIIVELVIYVSSDVEHRQVLELSCGWSKITVEMLQRSSTGTKIEIQGGSPSQIVKIQQSDINVERTGIKKFITMLTPGVIKSQIIVGIKPFVSLPEEEKIHVQCLPQTCLIQKKLLWFVSGYRNYAADTLFKESSVSGKLQQPSCNVVMSCLPKILDSPDIVEVLSQVWYEDITDKKKNLKGIEFNMNLAKDYITRLYPAIFSEGPCWDPSKPYQAQVPESKQKKDCDNILKSALRYGDKFAKEVSKQPIQDLVGFRPFNIRELEFSTYDASLYNAKRERVEQQLLYKQQQQSMNMF